jgi:hypothetical protein
MILFTVRFGTFVVNIVLETRDNEHSLMENGPLRGGNGPLTKVLSLKPGVLPAVLFALASVCLHIASVRSNIYQALSYRILLTYSIYPIYAERT